MNQRTSHDQGGRGGDVGRETYTTRRVRHTSRTAQTSRTAGHRGNTGSRDRDAQQEAPRGIGSAKGRPTQLSNDKQPYQNADAMTLKKQWSSKTDSTTTFLKLVKIRRSHRAKKKQNDQSNINISHNGLAFSCDMNRMKL